MKCRYALMLMLFVGSAVATYSQLSYMRCELFTGNAGIQNNCGPFHSCPGDCTQVTYDPGGPHGNCVWTDRRRDQCNAVEPYFVERHTQVNLGCYPKKVACGCDQNWQPPTIQNIVANCSS